MKSELKHNPEAGMIHELEAQTGISRSSLEKIKSNERLVKAFNTLLLSVGLGLGFTESSYSQEKEPQKMEIVDKKEVKTKEVKAKFIGLVQQLQEKGLLEFQNIPGHETVVKGIIGDYRVDCVFHIYREGDENIKGTNNERITIQHTDEQGTTSYIEHFFGNFEAYAINNEPAKGLEEKDKMFFFKKGVILAGSNKDSAYYKDLSSEEIEDILGDLKKKSDEEVMKDN